MSRAKMFGGDGGPPRGYLGQFVGVLVVLARDMIELEAVELYASIFGS